MENIFKNKFAIAVIIAICIVLLTSITIFQQGCHNIDKKVLIEKIDNEIKITESEIKTLKIKIDIDKFDVQSQMRLEDKKSFVKILKDNKKVVQDAIDSDKRLAKIAKEYKKEEINNKALNNKTEVIFEGFFNKK